MKSLTPSGWTWYQLIVAGVLLTIGSMITAPLVNFVVSALQGAARAAGSG